MGFTPVASDPKDRLSPCETHHDTAPPLMGFASLNPSYKSASSDSSSGSAATFASAPAARSGAATISDRQ
jgi:hypothetical protein